MTGLRKVLVGAAAVHLVLAALYAPHVPIELYMPRPLDRIVALYGSMSGVRNHFDFFAPSVSTQARVEFRVGGPDGTTRVMRLATPNGEVNNRIALMLTYYSYPDVRESLLKALGDLGRGPHRGPRDPDPARGGRGQFPRALDRARAHAGAQRSRPWKIAAWRAW
jgi:hypothetical protein